MTAKIQLVRQKVALRTILITIPLLLFVILPLSIFAYIKFLDYQDAQKFQSLKADMLTLQTEFNKIMPGWEYEEWCWGGGGPFDRRFAQGCALSMGLKEYNFEPQMQKAFIESIEANGHFRFESQRQYEHKGLPYVAWWYKYFKGDANCSLTSDRVSDEYATGINISCSGSARKFYFQQQD